MDSIVQAVKFTREAAAIRRCHTLRIIGEYSVGEHTFNMLSMLRILKPDASSNLIWAIVEHDLPERLTGDIPSPVKWYGAIDREKLRDLEQQIIEELMGTDHGKAITQEEDTWLKGLDILELYLFCKDQIYMGNMNLERMRSRIENYVKNNAGLFAPQTLNLFYACKSNDWRHTPDLGEYDDDDQ